MLWASRRRPITRAEWVAARFSRTRNMPKKSAPKKPVSQNAASKKAASTKRGRSSEADAFAPPPKPIVADLAKCLTGMAELLESDAANSSDETLEVARFAGLGGRAALAVLANAPEFDEAILGKLVEGETRFLLSE